MILRCRSRKYVITVSLPSTLGLLEMILQKAVVGAGAGRSRRYQWVTTTVPLVGVRRHTRALAYPVSR